ncbi:MAG: T9SS type A sorting domain-containing protein [Flavobacteriales bacterium]|nr:MAG: T9SS type A sorting domain-containing protein [Flavobacteriales bacterium]
MRVLPLIILVSFAANALAQQEPLAYVPDRPVRRTADSDLIALIGSDAPGLYRLSLPAAVTRVDMLNARGRRLKVVPLSTDGLLDLRGLRPGVYTVRAFTTDGVLVRRIGVLRNGRRSPAW